ncbi:hypothetical protein BT93_L2540 [Corymbia citriodora subsp. variegata]|uniref:Uncharacterized protein n=1 Tax=Corymbia citriodora subsp. variegata TaxID=360336 RepID=A0A8T0CNR6_CORYI|nr:hypothetical protein BT93_L2540 [Corymbia citriodora subsp. variegata]
MDSYQMLSVCHAQYKPSSALTGRQSSADLPAAGREPHHGQKSDKLRERWERGERRHGRRPRGANTVGTSQ